MDLVNWISSNLPLDQSSPFLIAIALAIIFIVVYDFYHLLFSAVLSWFKRV